MARKTDFPKLGDRSSPEHIACAHETCDVPARVRIQTATGWAKLCEPHYVMHFDNEARKHCAERGLDKRLDESEAAYRKRMLKWLRANAKPKTFEDAVRAEDEWAKTA